MNRNPKSHSHKKPQKLPSSSSSSESINIPNDILIEILKRLPFETLIRSTCVCKSWFSLLTSPTFLTSFISHNFTITPRTRLFKEPINVPKSKSNNNNNYTIINTNDLFEHHQIKCPVGNNHFCVCSLHGLVCLFDFYCEFPDKEPLFLWNPSIGKTVVVNVPCFDDGFLHYTVGGFPMLIFGFGFDPSSSWSSYKLIRIAYYSRDNGYGFETLFKTQIYDLALKKWRCLDVVNMSLNASTIRWRGLYLNGAIHWVCNVDGGSRRLILRFKLDCEKFGEIEWPKEVGDDVSQTVRVVVVPRCSNEVLGVVCIKEGIQLSIWVMDMYDVNDSWVKLFSINLRSLISNDMNVFMLGDDLVAVGSSEVDWVCYRGTTQRTRQFVCQIWIRGLNYVDTYVESLLLIGEKDGVLPGLKL